MRRFDFTVTCACLALLGYFAWHGLEGPRGFPYQDRKAEELVALQQKFADTERFRTRLDHRVSLLRPESLDPDMVDELARSDLQMARPGEFVATIPQ